jgi:hypothetical protein
LRTTCKGKLAGDDRKKVEERLQSDPHFALEVEKHSKFHNFIFERAMVEMKDQVEQIHQVDKASRFGWRNIFSITGSLVITALVFYAINAKIKYDEGAWFSRFKKKTVEVVQDTTAVVQVPVKHKKKSNTVAALSSADSLAKADTFIVSKDTTAYTKAEIEAQLSDILNSSVQNNQPESSQPQTKSTEAVPATNQKSSKLFSDCKEIDIEADISSENTCENKVSGKIKVDKQSVRGGEPPYSISVDGGKNYYPDFIVGNLSAARYTVYIKDANNCYSKLGTVNVKSVDCSAEYVFAPDKGEVWKIPTGDYSGELRIFSKQGKVVFTEDYDSPGSFAWDGKTNAGSELPMGAYMFQLKLSNGETLKGTITIVR